MPWHMAGAVPIPVRFNPGARDHLIDNKGVLWAIAHCPMTSGRSIGAFLRLVTAVQSSNANRGDTGRLAAGRLGDRAAAGNCGDSRGAHQRGLCMR